MSSENGLPPQIKLAEPATPNLGLHRPDQGSPDWHIPLNENFRIIDEAVGAGGGGFSEELILGGDVQVERRVETPILGPVSIPTTGTYQLEGSPEVDLTPMPIQLADGTLNVSYGAAILYVNGVKALVEGGPIVPTTNGRDFQSFGISHSITLQAGDTVTLGFVHDVSDGAGTPTTLTVLGTEAFHTVFSVTQA